MKRQKVAEAIVSAWPNGRSFHWSQPVFITVWFALMVATVVAFNRQDNTWGLIFAAAAVVVFLLPHLVARFCLNNNTSTPDDTSRKAH